mmetsp:Transcript_20256/g.51161  ORF Transcript_20256/g.51161 Transcript_20256/m.51161 type:complete len:237 (-) Transcript_20256:1-711(-)
MGGIGIVMKLAAFAASADFSLAASPAWDASSSSLPQEPEPSFSSSLLPQEAEPSSSAPSFAGSAAFSSSCFPHEELSSSAAFSSAGLAAAASFAASSSSGPEQDESKLSHGFFASSFGASSLLSVSFVSQHPATFWSSSFFSSPSHAQLELEFPSSSSAAAPVLGLGSSLPSTAWYSTKLVTRSATSSRTHDASRLPTVRVCFPVVCTSASSWSFFTYASMVCVASSARYMFRAAG